MKKENGKEDKVGRWPFLWGVLLYIANVDYVVIPFVIGPLNMSFWTTFWMAVLLANLEIFCGFYFWSWFTWKWLPTTEPVKDTVELTKNIITLLKEYGLLGTIKYKISKTFEWATSNKFSKFIKTWGHVGMFVLGAESIVSGGRLVGTVLCASMKWKNGLYALMVGNTIHIVISVWTWGLFFDLWGEYKRLFIVIVIVMITLFMAGRYILKRMQINKVSLKSP